MFQPKEKVEWNPISKQGKIQRGEYEQSLRAAGEYTEARIQGAVCDLRAKVANKYVEVPYRS